jgi:hypothetical protein
MAFERPGFVELGFDLITVDGGEGQLGGRLLEPGRFRRGNDESILVAQHRQQDAVRSDLCRCVEPYLFAADVQDDGKGTNKNDSYNWFIDIIPMDMTQPADGNASAFSIVLKLGNMFYLDHWAQTRGVNMADICAHTIFSAVDNELAKHK